MNVFWTQCISLVGLSLTVFTLGCRVPVTYSLFPLSLDAESEAEPALLGAWYPADGRHVMTFERDGERGYRVIEQPDPSPDGTVREPRVHGPFKLTRIGSEYFLSLSENGAGPRGYLFMKVAVSPERLSIHWVESSWLNKKASGEGWLSHVVCPDGDVLITAPTEHLRQFFIAHLYDEAAFDSGRIFTRTRPPAVPAPETER